jgi:hypothetical protein
MKIALCYSGQIRTGRKCIENQARFLGEHAKADTFLHTWTHNSNRKFPGIRGITRVPQEQIDSYVQELAPLVSLVEDPIERGIYAAHAAYWPPAQSLFYSWRESIRIMHEYEERMGIKYDVVVKLRPDIIFSDRWHLEDDLEAAASGKFLIPKLTHNPTWMDDERIYDDFFVTTGDNMRKALGFYTEAFENKTIDHINFGRWLHDNGMSPEMPTRSEFMIYRKEAESLDPMTDYDKIAVGLTRLRTTGPFFYNDPNARVNPDAAVIIIQPGESADYYK